MNVMRRFDVVLIGDEQLKTCLDAARILANPNEKNATHITVGGPFKTPPKRTLQHEVAGSQIRITGIGRFKGRDQNTVFLWCDSSYLRRLWRKPDHGYNPHITLYDGSASVFAERLYAKCADLEFDFSFPAGQLVSLTSRKGQIDFDLRAHFDAVLVQKLSGQLVSQDDLLEMDDERRLALVYAILRFVSKKYTRRPRTSYLKKLTEPAGE